MLHILLYVLAGVVLGGLMMQWWMQHQQEPPKPKEDVGDVLANAVLATCLWNLRKDDLAEEVVLDGTRLPTPKGEDRSLMALQYMRQPGRTGQAVRAYLQQQFPSLIDVEEFVLEVGAIMEGAVHRLEQTYHTTSPTPSVDGNTTTEPVSTDSTIETEDAANKEYSLQN